MRRQDLEHIIRAGPRSRATLPAGWEGRLVSIRNENTRQATGLCLEKHDLALSKLAAGREKDHRFVADALRGGIVDLETLGERLETMPLPERRIEQLRRTLAGLARSSPEG